MPTVSDDADVASAVKTAEETYGQLDIAFNNAGIMLADDSDSIATSEETHGWRACGCSSCGRACSRCC